MVAGIFLKIVLSLALGALIGIERERRGKGVLVQGIRTFMIVCLLGMLSAYFSLELLNTIILSLIVFAFVGLLTVLGYFVETVRGKTKYIGMTTEIAFLVTYLIGMLVYFDSYPYFISVSLSILLTLILVSRDSMHRFAKHLKEKEVWDAVIFAILTFIILPLLPNRPIDPWGAVNPFMIWLTIVIVLSVSFVGYILMKIFGARWGLGLTGLFGGLASSTAVAVTMAEKSRQNKRVVHSATFATIVASSTMFFRVIGLAAIINTDVAMMLLIPLSVLGVAGYIMSYLQWRKNSRDKARLEIGSPLALKPALQFGVFFAAILLFSTFVKTYAGDVGIYFMSYVAGLVDLDAINISLSTLAISTITPSLAARAIILAALSNTVSKWFLVRWLGDKTMAREIGKAFAVLVAIGIALIFLFSVI